MDEERRKKLIAVAVQWFGIVNMGQLDPKDVDIINEICREAGIATPEEELRR